LYRKIILASQSPRRKQLLQIAGVPFEVLLPGIEEDFPETLLPTEVPVYLACQKANAVKNQLKAENKYDSNIPILAADTIVILNNKILGKPKDENEAIYLLKQLSGNEHQVITGVFILKDQEYIRFSATTKVYFHPLTNEQIIWYVANCRPYDKAGAYGIQDWIGVVGVSAIEGDFYNVMGLPVSRILPYLLEEKS